MENIIQDCEPSSVFKAYVAARKATGPGSSHCAVWLRQRMCSKTLRGVCIKQLTQVSVLSFQFGECPILLNLWQVVPLFSLLIFLICSEMGYVMKHSKRRDSGNKDEKYNANDPWYKCKELDRMEFYGVKTDCR